MHVFITGANGFVGRNFVDYLLQNDPELQITALTRNLPTATSRWGDVPKNLRWIEGDLLAPETYRNVITEAEFVFHLAALVSLKNGPQFYTQNTDATRCLLETLQGSQALRRLIYLSSISAVDRPWRLKAEGCLTEQSTPQPNTDYGRSKLQAETQVIASGLPYTILIPAYIYGPYPRAGSSMERLFSDMLAGNRYTRFPFPGRASEVYVGDLAEMLWIAATYPQTLNRRYFVGNPEPVRVQSALELLASALRLPYEPIALTPGQIARYQSRWTRRNPDSLILRILFEDYFACSPALWYADTGYQPRYGQREGLERTLRWMRALA